MDSGSPSPCKEPGKFSTIRAFTSPEEMKLISTCDPSCKCMDLRICFSFAFTASSTRCGSAECARIHSWHCRLHLQIWLRPYHMHRICRNHHITNVNSCIRDPAIPVLISVSTPNLSTVICAQISSLTLLIPLLDNRVLPQRVPL